MIPQSNSYDQLSGSLALLIIILFFLTGCSTTRNAQQDTFPEPEISALMMQQRAEEYILQPGDEVQVSVWGYEEFNTTKTITGLGVVTVPLVGEVKAEGLSKEQFKNNLKEALAEYIKGEINLTITVTSTQENIVSVFGSVGRPDNYTIAGDTNLFQILSQAGGTTEQADLRNIKIYKHGQISESLEVDLTTYFRNENLGSVVTIHPGDIVYVPQQENVIRELSGFFRDVVVLFGLFRFLN